MKNFIKQRLREDLAYHHVSDATQDEYIIDENNGNYGYHAGDLKYKSGLLSTNDYMKTLVSQLGTGYFFFGDPLDAEKLAGVKIKSSDKVNSLKNTSIYKIDFSKYNTFKPRNASEFYDNLIIPMVKGINQLTLDDINNPEIVESLVDISDYYRELGVNISDEVFLKILKQYLSDVESKSSKSDDVLNTRILKSVGYEGVDLRYSEKDGIVNGRANVGSVIFDIKDGTVSPY